jgi:hypothetical protein
MNVWEESYSYLELGATEQDIATSSTADLAAAYHLMDTMPAKPPLLSLSWPSLAAVSDRRDHLFPR